jgi:hypothetical protein
MTATPPKTALKSLFHPGLRPARATASVWLKPTEAALVQTNRLSTTRCFLNPRLEREAHPEAEVSCIEQTTQRGGTRDLAVSVQRGDVSIRV